MTVPVPQSQPAGLPHHRGSLGADLRRLGVSTGDVVLVHASLRRVGFVVGGAVSVVQALLDVVGPSGTLVAPTFTAGNSDPSRWARTCARPVPPAWWPHIRDHLPAFDPAVTPSVNMGVIAETVRTWPGAVRSGHPQTSFAAIGAGAATLMATHPPDSHLGPDSPLGAVRDADAKVLLLGVPFAVCTTFHLAEYRNAGGVRREYECVVRADGDRRWYHYQDVVLDDSDFEHCGAAFEAADEGTTIGRGPVGDADSRLFPMAVAAAFADDWMAVHRQDRCLTG